ncbi:zinc-dependent peptidase [Glaciecola sp. SC05]|uniref:M90 family metallopeptidase n=1 Tax=Glaciecola sp. SC05 TaxID=1987355 RepID=UPI0035290A17
MFSYILLILVTMCFISLILCPPYWREFRRKQISKTPFKKEWRKIIQRRMPFFKKMPADLQLQLKQHIQIFLSEKTFKGLKGLSITDEIKVTIAAQACLLLLNRKTDYYPKLKTILVYPRAFVKEHQVTDATGVQSTKDTVLAGESWSYGKIVLSWQDTLDGAYLTEDGHNVVIHEFAHQLDQEDGYSNGAPILGSHQSYEQWAEVFSTQYHELQRRAQNAIPSIFDYYGATNPAEFFAVASEVFFEKSHKLKQQYPKLYHQLSLYYRVDPTSW